VSAGFVAGRLSATTEERAVKEGNSDMAVSAEPRSDHPNLVRMKARKQPCADNTLGTDPHANPDEVERNDLQARISELESELLYLRGKPFPFPEDLDERFAQAHMVEAMNKALADAETGAEISLVDCAEYPCVLCGTLPEQKGAEPDINSDLERLQRARKSPTLAPYKDDGTAGSVTTSSKKTAEGEPAHQTLFCQSFFEKPSSEAEESELRQRIDVRIQEITR
jgi:hypothetical protein